MAPISDTPGEQPKTSCNSLPTCGEVDDLNLLNRRLKCLDNSLVGSVVEGVIVSINLVFEFYDECVGDAVLLRCEITVTLRE